MIACAHEPPHALPVQRRRIVLPSRTPENAVWSYEQPYDDVEIIKDLLAFYPDKVEISISLSFI